MFIAVHYMIWYRRSYFKPFLAELSTNHATMALASDSFKLHVSGAVQLLLLKRFHQAQEERSQT